MNIFTRSQMFYNTNCYWTTFYVFLAYALWSFVIRLELKKERGNFCFSLHVIRFNFLTFVRAMEGFSCYNCAENAINLFYSFNIPSLLYSLLEGIYFVLAILYTTECQLVSRLAHITQLDCSSTSPSSLGIFYLLSKKIVVYKLWHENYKIDILKFVN